MSTRAPDTQSAQFRKKPKSYLIRAFDDLEVGDGRGVVHVGNKVAVEAESRANLCTVAAVLGVLWALSVTLTSSMRREILGPMQRIVTIIDHLIQDPLGTLHEGPRSGSRASGGGEGVARGGEDEHAYAVEKAILRVGSLLQLGLGEAGAKIISDNMKDGNIVFDRGGKLVHAIFGFCDIRNFTDCTEVLRADIVKLVNQIANHVHTCTCDNYGAPNKNIGDAFLLVWKPKGDVSMSATADASLRCYVRLIIQMQMCKELRRWEKRTRALGARIQMGYGAVTSSLQLTSY
jgi:hypothetical protein